MARLHPASILVALAVAAAFTLAPPLGAAAGEAMPARPSQAPVPAFEALKALAGEWEGTAKSGGDGKALATRATIRVVSNGSAVMLVTAPGTPHEMVTMFHRDDDALLATHYCAGMNQPRMKATSTSDAKQVTFTFLDGTNLGAYPGRMEGLVIAVPSADRHTETWTYKGDGQVATMLFELTRKR